MTFVRTEPLRLPHADRWRRTGAWRTRPFTDDLVERARHLPDDVVLVDSAGTATAEDLAKLVASVAAALDRDGIRAGDVVCSLLPGGRDAIALAHAAMAIGAVFAPVLPGVGQQELAMIVDLLRPPVVVVDDAQRACELRGVAHEPAVHVGAPRRNDPISTDLAARVELAGPPLPDRPALVLCTSGTTGRPKAVIHTLETLRAEAESLAIAHAISERDVILVAMPIAHIGGAVYSTLLPLVTRARAVLMPRWDVRLASELIDREGVTVLPGVPTFVRQLLACQHPPRRHTIRLVSMGGSQVRPADVDAAAVAFRCEAKRTYGSTEMPTLTSGRAGDGPRLRTTDGAAIGLAELRVVDEAGRLVPSGVDGEIECVGPELFAGYVDPSDDVEAFTADGWFRTGDIGHIAVDGYLSVTGRKDDLIIRGGENISPVEVETALMSLDGVSDAAVVGLPDNVLGERVHAAIVGDPRLDSVELRNRLTAAGLARHKVPDSIAIVGDLPRTATGKVKRSMIRDLLLSRVRT